MDIIKKSDITSDLINTESLEKQVGGMTINEIIAECTSHWNCGDCIPGLKRICHKYFLGVSYENPCKWELEE